MLNQSFINGKATFYREVNTFDGVEDTCTKQVLFDDIGVQICCSSGELFINSCGVKYTTGKDVTIKVHPNNAFPTGKGRSKYVFELEDCLGEMGRFQVEDITCINLPHSGIYAYKIIGFKIDG